ncbi:MAG TPA: hypothetical protein DD665_09705, partial [Alphaproteobacteria bacterium]|nr:hypothetical protein [Alphaproteobacteria bacterium]
MFIQPADHRELPTRRIIWEQRISTIMLATFFICSAQPSMLWSLSAAVFRTIVLKYQLRDRQPGIY